MKTFISYHNSVDELASKIKEYLDGYAFNCFLAHEDIIPQSRWPREIRKNLDDSELFLPLLTTEFDTSYFCQQETGYALCKGIEILPVIVDNAPMGFISDLQGIRFNVELFSDSCWKIVRHVGNIDHLSRPILKALIEEFGESSSYDNACRNAEKILSEFDFTPRQIKAMERHIDSNSQIYESKTARPYILKFIERYSASSKKHLLKGIRKDPEDG